MRHLSHATGPPAIREKFPEKPGILQIAPLHRLF
jgi:hypothetical protein